MGYVRSVPAGTMLQFVMAPSGGGITEAVHKWGQVLRDVNRLQRIPNMRAGPASDPVGRSLGYWTDVSATHACAMLAPSASAELLTQHRRL